MKRWIHSSTKKPKTVYISSSTQLSDREEILLEWAEYNVDPDLSLQEQVRQAEKIAKENGWIAFNSADEEFEFFWDAEDGDVERILIDFDVAYGNGDRLYPMDYQNGAQEAFYEWVKKNHPEADTSSFDELCLNENQLGLESEVDGGWDDAADTGFGDWYRRKQIRS